MSRASKDGAIRSRVLLGEITGVHGIRGDVALKTYTGDPEAIGDYGPLANEEGDRTFELRVRRLGPKGVIASVEGIRDRTAAEKLRGTKLYVDRARLPAPGEGEYYQADLIGLRVVSGDGTPLGTVVSIQNYGAGDLVEIRLGGGGKTELVPFTEAFVLAIDLAAGTMTVSMPEYVTVPEGVGDGDERE